MTESGLRSSQKASASNSLKMHSFKRMAVGYKKLREGRGSEDYADVVRLKQATICAVADGHGDPKCKFADKGAKIATEIALNTFRAVYDSCPDEKTLYEYIANNREQIIQRIIRDWNKAVYYDYISMKEPNEADIEEMLGYIDGLFLYPERRMTSAEARRYFEQLNALENALRKITLLYGSTLNIVMETQTFVVCMGIGDGDIIGVKGKRADWLLPPSEQFSTTTNSLCNKPQRAIEEFRSVILRKTRGRRKNKLFETGINPDFILVATDGFRNSFINDEYFFEKLIEINGEKSQGYRSFQDNCQAWIEQLTKDSIYQDDISFTFLYKI